MSVPGRRFYGIARDLHLYTGLFLSPFVLVFAVSVFFLVHTPDAGPPGAARVRTLALAVPPGIAALAGRARVDAIQAVLARAGVKGEIGYIRHIPAEHRMIVPVTVPGRETTVAIDLARGSAEVSSRDTGLAAAFITLHKLPGPHLAQIRMNWWPMRVWRLLADASVYLLLFVTASGVYLWTALRSERRIGLVLLAAGAIAFTGAIYALAG